MKHRSRQDCTSRDCQSTPIAPIHRLDGLKQNDTNLESMDIYVDAGFNRLGVTLQEEVDLPFPDIKLRIEATTDASDEKLQVLKRDLPRYCPIAKMIEGAGTKLKRNG